MEMFLIFASAFLGSMLGIVLSEVAVEYMIHKWFMQSNDLEEGDNE